MKILITEDQRIEIAAEKAKEIARLEKMFWRLQNKLIDANFLNKAPIDIILKESTKFEDIYNRLNIINGWI